MAAHKKAGERALGADEIRIRMYRVGFGDCFLVSFPVSGAAAADTHAHVLVDCGVHAKGDIGTMADIVADIEATSKRHLALVVATHAHQDHISGFDKFASRFANFKIEEVWLPWTWDPKDARARKLQKRQAALVAQLDAHFTALGARANTTAAAAVQNLKGNPHAIALLNSGFGVGAKVRYVRAGDRIERRGRSPVAGLTGKFLGPPDSEEFLAQMDPPAGQHYLTLAANGRAVVANALQPFTERWHLKRVSPLLASVRMTLAEQRRIAAEGAAVNELAFALDQARNNESVVALMIFRDQYLLFPGDAQYGNWRGWLDQEGSADILSRIRFLKVAHHGSVNATPKSALEGMSHGAFGAMVSTQSVPWASIPRVPLMARLSEQTKKQMARSDWITVTGAPRPAAKTAPPEPHTLPKGFRRGPLWIDYIIQI